MSAENKGESVHEWVKDYYGDFLSSSEDLKTNACCATGAPPSYLAPLLQRIHPDVSSRFYGCGFPIPEAVEGCRVLDLGCGTGRDAYLLSQLVGQEGQVHGVDMTASQLEVAERTEPWHRERFGFGKANAFFHQGYIEDLSDLPIESESLDVIVSNCVVNLSPRKDLVVREAQRLLRPGGEMYFSDVFVDRRLPEELSTDPVLYSECLGGALYLADFIFLAKSLGFTDPRIVSSAPITVQNEVIQAKVGTARFRSVTLRLMKLEGLDQQCEDYGHVATYRGTMAHHPNFFRLDEHHLFEKGRPERICGNTADMLAQTRFAKHFEVVGGKETHFGVFDCAATMAQAQYGASSEESVPSPSSGGCC